MKEHHSESPTSFESVSLGRTLIIGSTGFIGRFITDACLAAGRPTFLLLRPGPRKLSVKAFEDKGAVIIYGTITDQEFMEKTLREHRIEYVISAVGGDCIMHQLELLKAIKAVGHVKRFLPSEFGHDIDRAEPVEPGLTFYKEKRAVRRIVEDSGIPFTYICCNSIAAWPYHDNTHPADVLPPMDRFLIYGDGSVRAYFVTGSDIGKFTEMVLADDRAVNKTVHFQPPTNLLNINEMASLWEGKIGRKLPRITMTEEDLLTAAREAPFPQSVVAALTHDIFINGCQINYSLDKESDEEICALYPQVPFKTLDGSFEDFLKKMVENRQLGKPPSDTGLIGGVANTNQEALAIAA